MKKLREEINLYTRMVFAIGKFDKNGFERVWSSQLLGKLKELLFKEIDRK